MHDTTSSTLFVLVKEEAKIHLSKTEIKYTVISQTKQVLVLDMEYIPTPDLQKTVNGKATTINNMNVPGIFIFSSTQHDNNKTKTISVVHEDKSTSKDSSGGEY